jgi:uncharacterized protein (TIGR03086 family)
MDHLDQRALHRQALELATTYIEPIVLDERTLPTPCANWDLGQLLAHMVGQHFGFAAAARNGTAPKSAYRPVRFSPATWRDSVNDLLDAFERADLDATVMQVELHPVQPLPMRFLIGAQLLHTVVHPWDVASTLGQLFEPDRVLADAVLAIAEPIPDEENRETPGAAFAHRLPATGPSWARSLALLGRDPQWRAPRPVPHEEGRPRPGAA